ncbi:unnamed protein product, partial [Ascophyllum nodosum]
YIRTAGYPVRPLQHDPLRRPHQRHQRAVRSQVVYQRIGPGMGITLFLGNTVALAGNFLSGVISV